MLLADAPHASDFWWVSGLQAFRARTIEIVNQAQHFGYRSGIDGGGSAGSEFREGLESTERDRAYIVFKVSRLISSTWIVFLLVQRSAQRAQAWAEATDRR